MYDIKNIRQKIRTEDEHKRNSPWNVAADFDVDMSLPEQGIARMLAEYEKDCHTGMNIEHIASMFGFIKNENGSIAIANRIFETRLYNRYLASEELQKQIGVKEIVIGNKKIIEAVV